MRPMADPTGRRIESLAQENRGLVQALAEMVNAGIDAGTDLQPQEFNELATRALFCADEIARLARDLSRGRGGTAVQAGTDAHSQ